MCCFIFDGCFGVFSDGWMDGYLSYSALNVLWHYYFIFCLQLQFYESGTLIDLSQSTMHDVTRYNGPPCFFYRNHCLNNSRCVPNLDDFQCRCPPNFTGKICDICTFTQISFLSSYSYRSKHIFMPANQKCGSFSPKWFILVSSPLSASSVRILVGLRKNSRLLCTEFWTVDVYIRLTEGHHDYGTIFILWCLFYCVHFIDCVRFYCLFSHLYF